MEAFVPGEELFNRKAVVSQDHRAKSLYSDNPIIFPEDMIPDLIETMRSEFHESEDWQQRNYESDWVRYSADYQSIPGEMFKPWPGANDYFLPAPNITVENYVARFMESIRGAREFITIRPRGRSDLETAEMIQHLLRYQFEEEINGYKLAEDNFRNKCIFGTSISVVPYVIENHVRKIDGVYLFDEEQEKFVLEAAEEAPDPSLRGPKDFSALSKEELDVILERNLNLSIKDLFETVTITDRPDPEVLDIFKVKIDPNGGNDIHSHRFIYIETSETIDEIKRKAAQGIYDEGQVKDLLASLSTDGGQEARNDFERHRDASEDFSTDTRDTKGSVRLWIRYGRHTMPDLDLEDETISIIANEQFLLRLVRTPYEEDGVPYRPILVDRFIELPHRFYGIGICEILKDLSYLLNHSVNQILNHGDIYNSPPLIHPQDGTWDPSTTIMGPGQTIASDNSDGFKFLLTPDIKPSQIQMLAFIEAFIQKSLGVQDFTLQAGSEASKTAHGLANVLRESNRRIDFYAKKSHEQFFKKLFEILLKMNKKFMDDREIRIISD